MKQKQTLMPKEGRLRTKKTKITKEEVREYNALNNDSFFIFKMNKIGCIFIF